MRESGQIHRSNSILKAIDGQGHSDSYKTLSGFDHLWMELVKKYCARDLTFPETSYRHLLSIASTFRAMSGSQYVARLWRHDLARGLLWQRFRSLPMEQVIPSRAPSWSWAAVDGQIFWRWPLLKHKQISSNVIFQIQDVHIQETSPGSCGTVGGGLSDISRAPLRSQVYLTAR